jgi:hypothetical protein
MGADRLSSRSLNLSLNYGQVLNTFIWIFAVISAQITHCPLRNRDQGHDLCRTSLRCVKAVHEHHRREPCVLSKDVISPPSDNPLRVKGTGTSYGPSEVRLRGVLDFLCQNDSASRRDLKHDGVVRSVIVTVVRSDEQQYPANHGAGSTRTEKTKGYRQVGGGIGPCAQIIICAQPDRIFLYYTVLNRSQL